MEIDISGACDQMPYLEVALIDLAFPGWLDLSAEGAGCYRVYLAQEGPWEARLQRLLEEAKVLQLSAVPVGTIRDEDWAENWKKFYHPLEVGRHLVICPSWEKFQPRPDHLVITLDPGSAFGTGYHPTTQLCLELLEEFLVFTSLKHLRVLDLGCGSGILGLAAWKMGVRQLWAVDNDPVAVKVALENFEVNQVPLLGLEQAHISLGDDPSIYQHGFDLVVANLIATTLIEMASHLAQSVVPKGHLIVGGIIDSRVEEVRQALIGQGFKLVEERSREDWYSLHLERTPKVLSGRVGTAEGAETAVV